MGNAWQKTNREQYREYNRRYMKLYSRQARADALQLYGGKCVVCGLDDPDVLVFDHIYDDGAQHRRNTRAGKNIALWLKQHGYPQDIVQILCCNHNAKKEAERLRSEDSQRDEGL